MLLLNSIGLESVKYLGTGSTPIPYSTFSNLEKNLNEVQVSDMYNCRHSTYELVTHYTQNMSFIDPMCRLLERCVAVPIWGV